VTVQNRIFFTYLLLKLMLE